MHRASADVLRVVPHIGVPLNSIAHERSQQSASKDKRGDARGLEVQPLIETGYRERRVGLQLPIALLLQQRDCLHQLGGAAEFGDETSLHAPPPSSYRSCFISCSATNGTKRMNRRKRSEKKLTVPSRIDQSTQVGA